MNPISHVPSVHLIARLALPALVACHQDMPARMQPSQVAAVAVQVGAARRKLRMRSDEVVGTVRARKISAVSASVMGTLRELSVGIGSHVRAGDILAKLSAREIDAKAEQARARLAQADLNLHRAAELNAHDAMPSALFDATRSEQRVAQAALSEAEVMTGYMVIRAPISGVVTEKRADVGDLALPGKPLLVIENTDALRLEAALPETAATNIRVGQVLSARFDALGRTLVARVGEVAPTTDPASRTVAVKLDLPHEPALRPGMFGRLLFTSQIGEALVVPATALVRQGQLETVFVVRGGVVSLRLVRSGRIVADDVEVLAGLSEHEWVVSDGATQLSDGQAVAVKP